MGNPANLEGSVKAQIMINKCYELFQYQSTTLRNVSTAGTPHINRITAKLGF